MVVRRSQLWLRCVTGLATAAFVALTCAAAGAAVKGPTDFVKDTRAKLDKILAEPAATPGSKEETTHENKIREMVQRLFDFKELGIRSLDKHWATLKPAEADEFLKTLGKLIENNYIYGLKNTGAYTMKYLGEEIVGTQASVKTEITATPPKKKKPVTIAVEYRLVKDVKGEWRVYDIITDGDSLVDLYKAEFNKVIAKGGFPELLKKLKMKLESGDTGTAGTPTGSSSKP